MDLIEVTRFSINRLKDWAKKDLKDGGITTTDSLSHYFTKVLKNGWRLKSVSAFLNEGAEIWTIIWQRDPSNAEKGSCQLEDL